jgi:6-phosphofructokinase 1
MCDQLKKSRRAGRRNSIVILAEGVRTQQGDPVRAESVRAVIEESLGEEARVTILGHVQRGGKPTAYDRWASTWLGYEATAYVLAATGEEPAPVFGFHGEQVMSIPLVTAVTQSGQVPTLIEEGRGEEALALRGTEFGDLTRIFTELTDPARTESTPADIRIAVMHAGALAPGMNTAVKTAVRLGISRGFTVMGVPDGFVGLASQEISELTWRYVDGWNQEGGAALGTRRHVPTVEELYAISRNLESAEISGLVVVGGWTAYEAVRLMNEERTRYPGLQIPVVCVPATIDNNLPGAAMSIGADTALNVIVESIDRIKMSASASQRCFVIETMGRYCGYLALLGGFAGGAEQVFLHETGITMEMLAADIQWLKTSFDQHGRTLYLGVRNERANPNYTTEVMAHLFDQEGEGRYDTRTVTLGHVQQGDAPTPADRVLAARLVDAALGRLAAQIAGGDQGMSCVGFVHNEVRFTEISEAMKTMDPPHQRPVDQGWLGLKAVFDCVNREYL